MSFHQKERKLHTGQSQRALNLIYGVSVCALLLEPIRELLVRLVVRWDVEDGRR